MALFDGSEDFFRIERGKLFIFRLVKLKVHLWGMKF